jgi:hypothetical protein
VARLSRLNGSLFTLLRRGSCTLMVMLMINDYRSGLRIMVEARLYACLLDLLSKGSCKNLESIVEVLL